MTEWIQSVSLAAAGPLIESVWQGLLLVAMIAVCVRLAPRTTAAIRFTIWMAAFLAVAFLPLIPMVPLPGGPHIGTAILHAARPASFAFHLDSRWALAIVALWAVLASVRMAGLLSNGVRLAALRRRSAPVAAGEGIQALLATAGLRRSRLCVSGEIDQPCVIGFFAPRILIPEWLIEKATAAELEQIVLHEVSHLRRGDDWTNLLQKLALVCFPLNPALVWVERRLCAEREAACDESVIRATRAPREYATCLTNLAEERLARRNALLSLGAWEKSSQLTARVESILRGSSSLNPHVARAVMAGLVLATAAGAIQLGGSVALVFFAPPLENLPVAQVLRSNPARGGYQDVVFHPDSAASRPVLRDSLVSDGLASGAVAQPAVPSHARPAAKRNLRSGSRPAVAPDQVRSLIIVTSWEDSSGRATMTVIHDFVRISALSTMQSPSGWYVVQL
jgi:beta-lactamase regulating signal transducer with metallopeptidase domain